MQILPHMCTGSTFSVFCVQVVRRAPPAAAAAVEHHLRRARPLAALHAFLVACPPGGDPDPDPDGAPEDAPQQHSGPQPPVTVSPDAPGSGRRQQQGPGTGLAPGYAAAEGMRATQAGRQPNNGGSGGDGVTVALTGRRARKLARLTRRLALSCHADTQARRKPCSSCCVVAESVCSMLIVDVYVAAG